jgi:hypothetical protein
VGTLSIDPTARLRLQPHNYCRNNQLVSAEFTGKVAELLNQVARYRPKELFRAGGDVRTLNNDCLWRFAGHIGPMANVVVVRALMSLNTPDSIDNGCGVRLTIVNGSGTQLGQVYSFGGYQFDGLPSFVPDEFVTVTAALDASTFRDTSVRATIEAVGQGKVISVVCYEYSRPPDSDNGYCRQQYGIGDAILDTDRSTMQSLATSLYKRGAAPLFNFSSDRDVEAPKNTGLGTVNVLDNTTTSFSSDSPGYNIDLRYCNRKTATTVPCRFEAYLATDGGASLTLRLIDYTGNAVTSHTANSATPTWYQTTVNLPATLAKYDLMYTSGGVQGITCYAASLYQYTA